MKTDLFLRKEPSCSIKEIYFIQDGWDGTPLHLYDVYNQMNANEHIIKNPTETKLINATKISGRIQSGLGIGCV